MFTASTITQTSDACAGMPRTKSTTGPTDPEIGVGPGPLSRIHTYCKCRQIYTPPIVGVSKTSKNVGQCQRRKTCEHNDYMQYMISASRTVAYSFQSNVDNSTLIKKLKQQRTYLRN